MKKFRVLQLAALAVLGLNLVGCVHVTLPAPAATATTVESLRAANIAPSKAGSFKLAAGRDAAMDTTISGLRGSSVQAPNGSFSAYLKDVIVAELKAAALYDENSPIQIDAELSDSKVDAAIGTGTARLAAHFTVTRAGKRVFDKELAIDKQWESSFVGAVAIPAAINGYSSAYKELAAKLFQDPEFRAALAR